MKLIYVYLIANQIVIKLKYEQMDSSLKRSRYDETGLEAMGSNSGSSQPA